MMELTARILPTIDAFANEHHAKQSGDDDEIIYTFKSCTIRVITYFSTQCRIVGSWTRPNRGGKAFKAWSCFYNGHTLHDGNEDMSAPGAMIFRSLIQRIEQEHAQ